MSKIFVSLSSLLLFLLYFSFFIVQEGERGIVLPFNNIIQNYSSENIVYTPGLHFKWPILDTIKILDARIHTIDNQKEHFITKEKKELILNYYIKWRIVDFSRYYNNIKEKNSSQIELFLKRQINNQLQSYVSSLSMKEVISNSEQQLNKYIINAFNNKLLDSDKFLPISIHNIKEIGIKLVDIRIQKINLPDIMYKFIYSHMYSKQKAIALNKKIQNKEHIKKLHVIIDHKMSIILSEAQKQAFFIKGAAEAKVMQLFAENFNKEPDFYFFIRSLRAYENSFKNNENVMFINLNNEFFQHMTTITNIIN
ncbi:Modulator of FtsH protease HflC [Buchnera aphidicola (Cavariella theobaldi)]